MTETSTPGSDAIAAAAEEIVEALRAACVDYTDPTDYTWGDGIIRDALARLVAGEREKSRWRAALMACRICEKRWAAVFPAECDDARLECPSCGHPASEVADG